MPSLGCVSAGSLPDRLQCRGACTTTKDCHGELCGGDLQPDDG